jgi:Trk K+ transport system NAD-binding subunit
VTTIGRYFTIVLIISGLSIFLSAITVLSGDFLSARVEKIYSGVSRIEKRWMSNHIVLVGCDATNLILAEKLKNQNRNVIIVTADTVMADNLRDRGYHAYAIDYTIESNMRRFQLDRATDVVIDIRDSSKTVYVVLVVRKISKKVRISAVAQSLEEASHLSDLEINEIINPASIAAERLSNFIEGSGSRTKK